jgi:SAM-dependent methyltransferase
VQVAEREELALDELTARELGFWEEFNRFTRSKVGRPYIEGKLYQEIRWAVEELLGHPSGFWFDAGCGNLPVTKWLLEKERSDIHIWAGDIDISGAEEELRRIDSPDVVTVVRVDLREEWPFPENFFDGIVANHVFTFLARSNVAVRREEPLVKSLREAHRVLKPGGVLIWTVPRPDAGALAGLPHTLKYLLNPFRWRKYGPSLFITTVKTARYIRQIERKGKSGIYMRVSKEECEKILTAIGFTNLEWRQVFAKQSWLNRAVKQPR